jgi:DNA-binding response OmpR family regulator
MTILLVNDDRNQQETFCEVVRRIDPAHKCVKRFTIESALEFLLEPDCVLPDIIFLDLVFRNGDGKQMLKEIKDSATLHDIPVCIYAESSEQADRDEVYELGAIGYVVKQQNLISLSEAIKCVMATPALPAIELGNRWQKSGPFIL